MPSEALIVVDVEVDDAIYIGNSSHNEYMPWKVSDRKSKTVQRKNLIDDIPVRMTRSRTAQELPKIEDNAKFPHIPVWTGFKNINIEIMECLVVMESVYNVDAHKSPALLSYIANKLFGQQ